MAQSALSGGIVGQVERLTADKTINLDNSMTSADIQALIDAQPKYIPIGLTLTFQFADGTYTMTDVLSFGGFTGEGLLAIYGNTGEATALHTTQAVILNGASLTNFNISLAGNTVAIQLQWIRINFNSNGGY